MDKFLHFFRPNQIYNRLTVIQFYSLLILFIFIK